MVECRACPRLVAWREEAARVKVRRFKDETYWARPVPGFGDPAARLVLVGLAPAANGGNRTVPTLLFADGTALTNPSIDQVKSQLGQLSEA